MVALALNLAAGAAGAVTVTVPVAAGPGTTAGAVTILGTTGAVAAGFTAAAAGILTSRGVDPPTIPTSVPWRFP